KPGVAVAHATIPNEHAPDRLTLLNPQLFQLYRPLDKLKKKLALLPVHGVAFLSDEPGTRGEHHSKNACAFVCEYADVRKGFCQLAKELGIKLLNPKTLMVHRIDEHGFEITADAQPLRPKAVLLAGALDHEQAKALALP